MSVEGHDDALAKVWYPGWYDPVLEPFEWARAEQEQKARDEAEMRAKKTGKKTRAKPRWQPRWPEENDLTSPALHLASLKSPKKYSGDDWARFAQEVVRFANRWGFLGLDEHEQYNEWQGVFPLDGDPEFWAEPGLFGQRISGWYRCGVARQNPEKRLKPPWFFERSEPLEAIADAVERYQRVANAIAAGLENPVDRAKVPSRMAVKAGDELNAALIQFGTLMVAKPTGDERLPFAWSFNTVSLLGSCYAALFVLLTQGHRLRACASSTCGRLFPPGGDKGRYCCDECSRQQRKRDQRDREKLRSKGGVDDVAERQPDTAE